MEFGERCSARIDGGGDALFDRRQLGIETLDIGEVLECDPSSLTINDVDRVDAIQQATAVSSRNAQRSATRSELTEHHVQPAGGLGAQPREIMVSVREQPQDSGVIVAFDTTQRAMP